MNIASVSINRPVFATVMSILIIIFGLVGYSFLGVREYPSVDPPVVSVSTNAGEARALKPGDVVIQRGTNHAWVNTGTEPALLVAVLADATPV